MPAIRSPHSTPADTSAAVDAFMATLDHPHADAVQRLRALVLGVDPTIAEGIKWNAPSWRTAEYFATTHLRAKRGLGLVLHLGARARSMPAGGWRSTTPTGCWSGVRPTVRCSRSPTGPNSKRESRRCRPCCGNGSRGSERRRGIGHGLKTGGRPACPAPVHGHPSLPP